MIYKTTKLFKKTAKSLVLLFVLIFFLINTNVKAQTVLISPTGDGGFETGTTFAANGWTAVNGTNTNRVWYVGTGQGGYTGNRCAFIGNSTTNVGTNDKARTVHIYKSITIPAGATNINLSFKYKQETADFFSGTYYDFVSVYTDNNIPTNGNIPAGTLQFGPYPNSNVALFTTQNTTLPNSLAGTTTNLIFTFKCDNEDPKGYGAIDDVSLTYTPLVSTPPTITGLGATSGCVGTSITINGTNLTGATAANVTIGGTAVTSITSNNGTTIVAIIGAGTTGTVSVTTVGGTATSASTYTVNPLPTITGTTPGSRLEAGTVNISATSSSGTTISWYSLAIGGSLVGTSASGASFTTPSITSTTTYYAQTTNGGCVSPRTAVTATVNTYCIPNSSTNFEYISRVQINTIDNSVSNNGAGTTSSGYSDFTTISTNLTQGSTYTITITPLWPGGSVYTEGYSVWIDYNQDGDFSDPGEQVFTELNNIGAQASGTFSVSGSSNLGATRMRVAMDDVNIPTDACEPAYNYNYGEVEDYTVNIVSGTPTPEIDIVDELDVAINSVSTNSPSASNNTAFGTVSVGSTLTKTYTIKNTGSANLTISSITSSNPIFAVTTVNTTIAAGGSLNLNVSFTPLLSGTVSATITVNNNDTNEGTYTFTVNGEGTASPPKYTAFFENFDASNGGWTAITSTNDSWVWTNTYPASAPNEIAEGGFWRNSNFVNYANNTNIIVESPAFDFSNYKNLRLSLDVKYKTQAATDGMRILYSINGGAYTLLGASGSGIQWYEGNVTAVGSAGWSGDNHTPAPAFAPYSQFTRSTLNLSDITFSGKTNVKFRIEFSSNASTTDEGVAFDNFLIESDPIVALGTVSEAPANIKSNLRIWLKANSGIAATDGAKLTNWTDQAFNTALDKEDAVAAATLAPTFRNSAARNLNFNPVIDFNNTNTEYMQGKGGFYSQDYFVVVKSDDVVSKATGTSERQFPIGGRFSEKSFHEDPTGLAFGSSTGRYVDEVIAHNVNSYPPSSSTAAGDNQYGRAYTSSSATISNILIINVKANALNTIEEIYKNGKKIDNTTGTTGTTGTGNVLNYAEFKNLPFLIGTGRSGLAGRTSSQLNGRLTEVISYSSANSAINQQKIQSYLAIKYGVTLQQSGSALTDYRLNDVNYIDSQGATIWDSTESDIYGNYYNYDIAGIGRDDNSKLNQKQSKSQNEEYETDGIRYKSGLLTIGLSDIYDTNSTNISSNPTNFIDLQFLVWGNNNASLDGAPLTVEVDMSAGITPLDLTDLNTLVSFEAIPRIWKVVENVEIGGDIPKVKVSIPTNAVRTAVPPDGRYLMFISDNGIFDPTADYRVMTESGGNLYTEYDFDGTKYITFGWAPEREFERSIYFEPTNKHYIDMEDNLDLNPSEFTISAWIKRDVNSANTSILSKRNVGYTEGYDFKIDGSGKLEMSWGASGVEKITSITTIPEDVWHQVAVIYSGNTASLYIDGVLDKAVSGLSNPSPTASSFFIAAACKNTPEAYFHGNIDEVRIWDKALSEDELRYIMNQEIIENATFVGGKIIPNTIPKNKVATILWDKLAGYYPMSVYTYTNTKDASGNGHQGALKNLNTVDRQTTPLPYVSTTDTNWNTPATWVNGTVQTIPGAASIIAPTIDRNGDTFINNDDRFTVDWNIVQINSDVTMDNASLPGGNNEERSVLGLFINGSKKLTVDGLTNANYGSTGTGNGLKVTHYLNLAGTLDLQGESQLIQTDRSILESSATGNLELDQQGTLNSFNYNYWTSSVGPLGAGIDVRNNYTIKNTLNDGSTPASPETISFNPSITWADNPYSGNKRISTRWLHKFYGMYDHYDSWIKIDENTNLLPGEGYSMKGTSGATAIGTTFQNYVFKGLPYNGDFTLPLVKGTGYVPANLTGNVDRLIGNPYPSAMDSRLFILDNLSTTNGGTNTINIFNGALYFWDHFGQKDSHILKAYVGGYATRNLTTGVKAQSTDARINNDNSLGDKTPGRYIPVNQAFFVNTTLAGFKDGNNVVLTTINGGNIEFKNSQRVFQKESLPLGNSVFMKAANTKYGTAQKNESVKEIANPIIRLMFDSPTGYHRQIAIGAVENTTNHFDIGYDAFIADIGTEDMYWTIQGAKFVIQGVPNFDENQEFPLAVKIAKTGLARIKIDELENMDENISIYIKDNLLDKTHNISQKPFEIALEAGTYNDRFAITFKMHKLIEDDVAVAITEETQLLITGIQVFMDNTIGELQIKNTGDTGITGMALYNYLGQTIKTWNSNLNRRTVSLPINVASGVYLLQINTKTGTISKKIVIE